MNRAFYGEMARKGKDISACGIVGIINKKREKFSGDVIRKGICLMTDRGNGLGAGFAAYGIYPDHPDDYALHLMYMKSSSRVETEDFLRRNLLISDQGPIPTGDVKGISSPPGLYRYFVRPDRSKVPPESGDLTDDDIMVNIVMMINGEIDGSYVFSSGKNMGAFKGVGNPADIADFFLIGDYEGYIWTAHNRFPTNTPGWWGGAHPFTLLDWSIIHNGEISSYGINKRYLEMFGYKLELLTDTEVVSYTLDLLIRRHKMPMEIACRVLAAPLWADIDDMPEKDRKVYTAIRQVYGSALLNGPFAFVFAHARGMVGLNDRIKLRPLVVGTKGDYTYMASEEAAIREICPSPDEVWAPRGGDPVVTWLEAPV